MIVRRSLFYLAAAVLLPGLLQGNEPGVNLGCYATATTSFVSPNQSLDVITSDIDPRNSRDAGRGAYGNWPSKGVQWVEYDWSRPISTQSVQVYWWNDWQGIRFPVACRLLTWDGERFVPVPGATGLGLAPDQYNETHFPEITTSKLRLEFTGDRNFSTGILQWKVQDSGKSPPFAPKVRAGHDATVVSGGELQLAGVAQPRRSEVAWNKLSGPGDVTFDHVNDLQTAAHFSTVGNYVLQLTGKSGDLNSSATLQVEVIPALPISRLLPVYTTTYKIDSPLWSDRLKQLIVHWVPHCMNKLSEPNLKEGGVQNLIEAGKKNAGKPYAAHVGPPWSDAYVFMTMEAMCRSLALDAQGDKEILQAQESIRAKLEDWIAITLAAQEKDGYLQSRFTLGTPEEGGKPAAHWTQRGDHEGYVAGAMIEAAIADYQLTDGKDRRLYDAALRLVDCWSRNIGPAPRKAWYDGHEKYRAGLISPGSFSK